MPRIILNGEEIEVQAGITVLQACEAAGVEIPHFCFHERLSVAGNCRMCLVEWVGAPKLQPSCALSVDDLRFNRDGTLPEIRTDSAVVRNAREGVMEFLLANHPLDCPICDQGGECDLQDQAVAYGHATSRFHEMKRAVEDKYLGPLVKTCMTRCIHCTRCVRFVTEVAGVADLGSIGRGEDMEITTYLEQSMVSELQGNVIDLCPVGALTSRPYAFRARPWELTKTETVDVMDAVGSSIRVDSRDSQVMRVLPRSNDAVNEEWISDKTRFIWDGLRVQRLDRPYMRRGGTLVPCSWREAFAEIGASVQRVSGPERIGGIVGDLCTAEEIFVFKEMLGFLGVENMDCRQDGSMIDPALGRGGYLFNPTIQGIEQADAVLMVGAHPRYEAAVLNARIRKRWCAAGLPVGVVGGVSGGHVSLTYDYEYLGDDISVLTDILSGEHGFREVLGRASNPMILVGQGALSRADGRAVWSLAARVAREVGALSGGWNGFAVLHTAAARVAGLDLGFVPHGKGHGLGGMMEAARQGKLELLFLLGADEVDMEALGSTFVVYIGSHGDKGAHRASIILPGATYLEKPGTYVNTEGRVQWGLQAIDPPGEAQEDWHIISKLSGFLGNELPYGDFHQLREAMYGVAPHLSDIGQIRLGTTSDVEAVADIGGQVMEAGSLASPVSDFYLTNPIARSSTVMADLSRLSKERSRKAAGNHV